MGARRRLVSTPSAVGALVLAGACAAGAWAVSACSAPPDSTRITDIYTTDNSYEQFVGRNGNNQEQGSVEAFLEVKCASLDCHGQIGRPLRLFSQDGLRLVDDAGAVSGGTQATSDSEKFANYTAAIGLQPELTSMVFAGFADPNQMLLLRKPLQAERHKGGQVIVSGDAGYKCLYGWLVGVMDFQACKDAVTETLQ